MTATTTNPSEAVAWLAATDPTMAAEWADHLEEVADLWLRVRPAVDRYRALVARLEALCSAHGIDAEGDPARWDGLWSACDGEAAALLQEIGWDAASFDKAVTEPATKPDAASHVAETVAVLRGGAS